MAISNFNCKYFCVVSTDRYTGNFERELCGYATGASAECGVGDRAAEDMHEHLEELGLDPDLINGYMSYQMCDTGIYRPVSIYDNDDGHNSLVMFFDEELPHDEFKLMCDRIHDYGREKKIEIKSIKFFKRQITIVDTEVKSC